MQSASSDRLDSTRIITPLLDLDQRIARYSRSLVPNPNILMPRCLVLAIAAACAGCSIQPTVVADNYLTYDYAIAADVDAAIAKNATEYCGRRKQIAIRTQYTCVGTGCITTYQCMSEAAAREDGLLTAPGK